MSKQQGADHVHKHERYRVVLVMTLAPEFRSTLKARTEELVSLLDTAHCDVVATAHQHLQKPVSATHIGKGKIEEVCQLVEQHKADEVVFDCDLTPSQERNLSKTILVPIVDYSGLILHIFAQNARTHQAHLAVELAQLEYHRSRLKRLWDHLDRIKAGTNMRGPGEKQLEVDKRLIKDRIRDLQDKLAEIEKRKERAVESRDECFKVCLVGYTNSGKSSLMNALTHADVLAEDRLFATLDTRTAKLDIDRKHKIVLSDTVGFIRNLPHQLIASFHATLSEVIGADLLLHVVDASQPYMEEHIHTVEDVLTSIGAGKIPTILVFNKIDREHSKTILMAFKHKYKGSVATSAIDRTGLDQLNEGIRKELHRGIKLVEIRFPISDGAINAFVRKQCNILQEEYTDTETIMIIEADEKLYGELDVNEHISIKEIDALTLGQE